MSGQEALYTKQVLDMQVGFGILKCDWAQGGN